jgi:hypothetical protein
MTGDEVELPSLADQNQASRSLPTPDIRSSLDAGQHDALCERLFVAGSNLHYRPEGAVGRSLVD